MRVDIAEFFYLGMGLRVYACERAREIVGAPTRDPFNSHDLAQRESSSSTTYWSESR